MARERDMSELRRLIELPRHFRAYTAEETQEALTFWREQLRTMGDGLYVPMPSSDLRAIFAHIGAQDVKAASYDKRIAYEDRREYWHAQFMQCTPNERRIYKTWQGLAEERKRIDAASQPDGAT